MPLLKSKSKKAVSENIESEMDAGKPQKQSIAIALDVQRRAKKKKMAFGGKAEDDSEPAVPMAKPDDERLAEDDYMSDQWTDGVAVKQQRSQPSIPKSEYAASKWAEGGSVADDIMRKRKMAEGGEVEGPEHDSENPADMWESSEEAGLKENYSDSGEHEQPEDSNLMGHELSDEDEHDMVEVIRRKMRMKRGK